MIGLGEVHLWYVDLQVMPDSLSILDPAEQARAARFVSDTSRQQFIAARAQLRLLLGQLVGLVPEQVAFATTGNGKPILADLPTERQVHFNLSHSGRGMVLAVSRTHEVGVDLEWLRPRESYRELAARYFTSEEVARVTDLRSFYEIWTRKEAFLKALGLGLAGGLQGFAVNAGEPPCVLHVEGDVTAGQRWTLASGEPREGAIVAVAIPAPNVPVIWHP
ncbi:MAG: 4'-phosphopantetheinyl transferase superfamily protein [Gemmataceae bacterium]